MLDQGGAVIVEATLMIVLTLVLVLGSIDFFYAFYQWNMANKAVQLGARIAAVSDPVAAGLASFDWSTYTPNLSPGDALAIPTSDSNRLYLLECNGATATCANKSSSGFTASYSATAMDTIVYGRGNTACNPNAVGAYNLGMCNLLPGIGPANVKITYEDTGLGYAYRPDGPIPTIVVQLQNVPFHFFFLSGLLGFTTIDIPAETTTITGEDLSSTAP